MPSVASNVARVLFKHGVEADNLENELAGEEQSLRAQVDPEDTDKKDSASKATSRPAPSGGRAPIRVQTHDQHIDNRVARISELRDRQDVTKRKPQRDRHARELAAVRAKPATPGKHVPQREPETWQPTYTIWKDLNDAQRSALRGIFESTAKLRDNADADVLNINTKAGRYMSQKVTQDDAQSRAERVHLDINKKEDGHLAMQHSKLEAELQRDKRLIHEDAVERAALDRRQMDRRAMR
jgi:hypothetical protein